MRDNRALAAKNGISGECEAGGVREYCFFSMYINKNALKFAYVIKLLYLCTRKGFKQQNNALYMNNSLKYLGVVLLLLGVLCLIIYKFALPSNILLIAAVVLEVAGILSYIFINKKLQ